MSPQCFKSFSERCPTVYDSSLFLFTAERQLGMPHVKCSVFQHCYMRKKTGTLLLNMLLLSTLSRLHITRVAAGAIVMCGVLSCPTQGTPNLLVALPLKNNSTSPLISRALQRNDWVLITPYLLFLIRKCLKHIDLFHNGGLLVYYFKYVYSG